MLGLATGGFQRPAENGFTLSYVPDTVIVMTSELTGGS